ncbi:MAG: osmoprotectant transport system permease protein [Actinomycetota bacterium]|jgi:osmoprotectant transport system permease protein|nr:osmoprotectant transport system permease protein [Actinomycetota bacterium]
MDALSALWEFLSDPANWSGTEGIPNRVYEHIQLSGLSLVIAMLIALPVGLFIGHTRRFSFLAISIGNLGRALPSFAVLALVLPFTLHHLPGLGFYPSLIAMILLAIPPIITNTFIGISGVDDDTLEAARGMGMREIQVLRRVELPLAAPLIVAGLRTAAVAVVATATLAALVAWGGLGRFIIDGFAQGDDAKMLTGAISVALLALVTELGFGFLQRSVDPTRGERKRRAIVPGSQSVSPPESLAL